jgi:hypothetical protein
MKKSRDSISLAKIGVTILFVLSVITFVGFPSCNRKPPATGGPVSGSIYFQEPVGETFKRGQQILLPDIEVFLRNTADGKEGPTVTTDAFGRYQFPHQAPGTYELKWKAQKGWSGGQHANSIVIESGPRFPVPARVQAESGVIFGRVTLGDGRTPWSYDELFKVNHTATVTILNAARTTTLAGPQQTNSEGRYAVAGLPRSEPTTIQVQSEAATISRALDPSRVSMGSPVTPTDVQLPNQPPEIVSVTPKIGGSRVQTAAPGATVTLVAGTRDLNGDPLQFDWSAASGNGTVTPAASGSATWTLPNFAGRYTSYLQVRDGRGGFSRQQIDFITARTETTFAGIVIEKGTGARLKGADVVANGKTTTTDANGFFRVKTPLTDRYVLNISLGGFATFSRVVDAGLTGQTWPLLKTQSESVDPNGPIDLVDKRPELDRKKLRGTRIRIPAKALVDSAGNAPTGMLTAHLATLNIADGEAPGDWGAMRDASETNLISYGATFVEFRDAAGAKYNLAPGMSAEVQMFAPPSMLPGAPSGVKLWSYDEADGFWKVSGSASLQAGTGSFEGKVSHFSTINTDVEKEDDTCLKVLIYPPIPTGVKLRVTNPGAVAFSQSFEGVLDAGINAVFRLPANTNVQLDLLDADSSPYDGNILLEETPGIPAAGNVVNTGPPIVGSPFPPEPYEPCKLVILREADEPTSNAFLAFKGQGTDAQAAAYYQAVDPTNERETLGEWWTKNGFTFDASGESTNGTRTSYLNFNDLGSGRDMHFLQRADGTVAAYVTNYGLFNQDPNNADLAADRDTPTATVAMEYGPVEGEPSGTRIVKFFVYKGGDFAANAPRATSANLDGFAEKYVPNLCINCHGGNYSPSNPPTFADINAGATFRELDIATYKFPDGRDLGQANATEKAAFHQQNLIVKGAAANDTITNQAIKDLISGWYSAGTDEQDNSFTPSGWAGAPQQGLYQDVVKQSCRTCHVALDASTDPGGLGWITYEQLRNYREFGLLQSYALCDPRLMPHAAITYRNFWLSTSPHRPAALREFTNGSGWPEIGPCT